MNYEQIETDIVTRLAPLAVAGEVVRLPEKQADYVRPFEKYKITVAYKSSKFEDPHTTAEIAQFEDVMIDVTIEARTLRGTNGCHTLMESVRRLLLGFEPLHCSRMYLKESGFTELSDNLWSYSLTFVTRGMVVEDETPDDSAPLNYIEVKNPEGETVIQTGTPPELGIFEIVLTV